MFLVSMFVVIADTEINTRNFTTQSHYISGSPSIWFCIAGFVSDIRPEFISAYVVTLEIPAIASIELDDKLVVVVDLVIYLLVMTL